LGPAAAAGSCRVSPHLQQSHSAAPVRFLVLIFSLQLHFDGGLAGFSVLWAESATGGTRQQQQLLLRVVRSCTCSLRYHTQSC
jgi:hypothetical protein